MTAALTIQSLFSESKVLPGRGSGNRILGVSETPNVLKRESASRAKSLAHNLDTLQNLNVVTSP